MWLKVWSYNYYKDVIATNWGFLFFFTNKNMMNGNFQLYSRCTRNDIKLVKPNFSWEIIFLSALENIKYSNQQYLSS